MHILTHIFVCLAIAGAPSTVLAQTVSGTVTMEFDLSGHGTGEEAQLWIPYPVSNKSQLVTNVRVSGTYDASAVYTERLHETPMLYANWDAKNQAAS